MGKLNQLLAVTKDAKKRADDALTRIYHTIQKPEPLRGRVRTYTPKDDEGDRLPAEVEIVQSTVPRLVNDVLPVLNRMIDVVAQVDETNTVARADIVIDGSVLIPDVPATTLLFLEKQLVHWRTLASKLPVLDPTDDWSWDPGKGAYVSAVTETTRTQKVPRNHVLVEATDKHPAQVQVYTEDVVVGYWKTVKLSGAVPADVKTATITRIDNLADAVKTAREKANSAEASERRIAQALTGYAFAEVVR